MPAIRVLLAAALLLAAAAPAHAQRSGALGPVDGAGLPPTDTGRVAVGDVAPDFALLAKDGQRIALSGLRGRKAVVLVFYRGHW